MQRGVRRAHSPDFESPQQNYRAHPFQRQSGPPYQKRHRGDYNALPQTIEDKIARLGETGSRNSDIGMLAKEIDIDLMNKVNEEEKIKNITSKICQCIISFPTRVATYATLVGLISVKHYNVSCQIINTLHASYPVYLEAQKWQEAITIIHLLSSLVNCKVIRPSALISQFELLLEITLEENVPQARADYYVYTVLSSLPYVALELTSQSEPNNFEQIINMIETYLGKRSKDHLNATRVWLSTDSTVQMDYLDSLWVQLKNFKANGWNETFLHRPYNDKEYKDIMSSSLIPTNSPTIQIPAHSDKYIYPPPRIVFRIFEDDVAEGPKQIPGSDKIERFCIENYMRNIIDEIPKERKDCARHLCHMYGSHSLPMKHLLIETVLGEIFALPKTKHPEILYYTLLYEFTKIFHNSPNKDELKYNYDVLLNEAIKILYRNLDTMNVTCITRFVQWLTFHLNNTEFLFPWQTWTDATSKDKSSPTAVFVHDVLEHCVRFSFYLKINALVGSNLSSLMPAEAGIHYKPVFADDPKAAELKDTIRKLIFEKADGKRIAETLNIEIEGIEMPEDFMLTEEKLTTKLLKVDIFVAVIHEIAAKSLTHLTSAVGKYLRVLKALVAFEGGQVQLLQTMHSCLETHPQLQVILVDKFLKAGLVEASEVCNWIFSDMMKPHHLRSYPWELLDNTIYRTLKAVDTLIAEKNKPVEEEKPKVEEDEPAKEDESSEVKKESSDVDMHQEDTTAAAKQLLDEKIEQAKKAANDLILQTFRMFANLLGDHIRKCEASNTSYMDNWFRWIAGRMQEVYYKQHSGVYPLFQHVKNIIDEVPSIGSFIMDLNQ